MLELLDMIGELSLDLCPHGEELPHLSEGVLDGSVLVLERPLDKVLHG